MPLLVLSTSLRYGGFPPILFVIVSDSKKRVCAPARFFPRLAALGLLRRYPGARLLEGDTAIRGMRNGAPWIHPMALADRLNGEEWAAGIGAACIRGQIEHVSKPVRRWARSWGSSRQRG